MNTNNKELREDIEHLLPWHAAGTLSRRDAERVESALANDNELASRYEAVREELGEAIRLNESLGAPSARAMETLFAKIDAEPARAPKASIRLSTWITGFIASFQPRTLAYAGGVAAVAIMLQAGLITNLMLENDAFKVQSTQTGESLRGIDTDAYVLIRFKPESNITDISKFLEEHNAKVTGGPAAGSGLFRVRVAEKPLSPAEIGAIVKRMQGNPVVGFTVPAAQ